MRRGAHLCMLLQSLGGMDASVLSRLPVHL
jgi:hypothetical protein